MSGGGVHIGRAAACTTAALALAGAALPAHRWLLLAPAALAAALPFVRWRGKPLLAPAGPVARYARRRRHATHPDGLFPLVCPGATVTTLDIDGASFGAVRDGYGLFAVIELGDLRSAVRTGAVRTPDPAGLTSASPPAGPPVTAQTLVVARGPYRRIFTVLRAGADGAAWRDAQLREALAGAVRRALRRLGRLGTAASPLDAGSAVGAVVWAVDAGAGTAPAGITEEWDHLRVGGMLHATLRVQPPTAGGPADLLVRLLRAPATTVAVASTASGTTVRLSAPTPADLATAVATLLSDLPGIVSPRDGDQYPGLRATLPLATAPASPRREAPPDLTGAVPPGGVLIGVDRTGRTVHLRIDEGRPVPVRVAVVGGAGAARMLGARLRALTDAGTLASVPVAVSVLDPLTPADAAALSGADVVICQPLSVAEAALVAATLHLTRAGSWLSRIEGDMIAVISDGIVRWVRLGTSGQANPGEQSSHSGMVRVAGP